MKNFFNKYWLLILIIILASLLRFYKLGSFPAINADEASNAYDAYSLIETGKDQHGNSWPIHFQSFNDYKPGLYVYLDIPFVKFMGLNPLAARMPGAICGVLSVLFIYLLTQELFANRKLSILSSLFLAISPWHIHYGRGGWEVNVSTTLIILGVWLLTKAVKEKSFWSYLFGIFSLVLSMYAYHAARVLAPLLGLGIVIFFRKEVQKSIKYLLISLALGIVLAIPLAKDLLTSDTLSRAAGVGLFADVGPINRINEQRGEHALFSSTFAKLIHNKAVNYGLEFAENWASHYHGLFLFVSGDVIQRNAVPETGQMYLYDIAFILIGIVYLISNFSKEWKFVIYWLSVAPLASALTFQSPNALRSQNMVVPLVIISAAGFVWLLEWMKSNTRNKSLLTVGYILLASIIIWNLVRYLHLYYVHMAKEYPFSSQYGIHEMVNYVNQNQEKYDIVYITTKYDQPYILYLFYSKYAPTKFQGNHILTAKDSYGFSTVGEFGKYRFGSFNVGQIISEGKNAMTVIAPSEVPQGAKVIDKIYGENGYEYFDIITN